MRKRDIVEEEVQQLNQFLKRLISKILGQEPIAALEIVATDFKQYFAVDFDSFLNYTPEQLQDFIKTHKVTQQHLETMASLLEDFYKQNTSEKKYIHKAIALLEAADYSTKSFSLERHYKKNQLKSFLN